MYQFENIIYYSNPHSSIQRVGVNAKLVESNQRWLIGEYTNIFLVLWVYGRICRSLDLRHLDSQKLKLIM